jgi:dinuclear metal center YbgI/SA1388 family protein
VTTVQEILNILTNIAADDLAETWDNVGLLIGAPKNRVSSILIGLDPSSQLISQALEINAELIITHHPVIFHPLKALRVDQPVGQIVSTALKENINIIGCHTNFDSAVGGVSDVLAKALGIIQPKPLIAAKDCDASCGLGRIGNLDKAIPADIFIADLQRSLSPPWMLEAGPRPEMVSQVAVCGGSCSDFAEVALEGGADVFITAEIKHATARWAEESGLWLIDAGHFATENPAMKALQRMLSTEFKREDIKVTTYTAHQESPLQLIQTK